MVTETITSDSEVVSRVDFREIMDEIVLTLRNNVVDRQERASSDTDSFTGDGTTTTFEFTNDLDSKSRHKIMNVKSVTIDDTEQTVYEDYVVGYRKDSPILGKIQFWNAPDDSAAIVVSYDWQYSFVYSESPRIDLPVSSYPRINVQIKETSPEEAAVGGKVFLYEIPVYLTVTDLKRDDTEDTMQEIVRYFNEKSQREGFWHFQYIRPVKLSGVIPADEEANETVYGQQYELLIPYEYVFSK